MSGTRSELSLVGSHASQAPSRWFSAGGPSAAPTDAIDEIQSGERVLFPGGVRCSLRQVPIRCDLPQPTDSRHRRIPILGTARARVGSLAGVVAVKSCAVTVDDTTREGSWKWSDLAIDSGRVVANRRVEITADEMIGELCTTCPLTERSLDLPQLVQRAGSQYFAGKPIETGLPIGPEQELLAVVEDVNDGGATGELAAVDVRVAEDSESGKRHRTALRIRRSNAPATQNMATLQAEIDLVAAHQWLLIASEEVLRRLFNLVDRMDQMTPAVRRRALRDFWSVRAASVQWLEGAWTLDVRASQPGSALPALDSALGLSMRWRNQIVRLQEITQIVEGLGAVPARRGLPDPPTETSTQGVFILEGILPKARAIGRLLRSDAKRSHDLRTVEMHPFTNRDGLFQAISTSLTVSTLMTATAGILLGLLLQRDADFKEPVDVLLLFVSTFAFFFATLVLNNAARNLARRTSSGVETDVNRATAIAEFLGQYTFIAALPLAIVRFIEPSGGPEVANSSGSRTLVAWVVACLAWLLLLGYHWLEGMTFLSSDLDGRGVLSRRQGQALTVVIAVIALLIFFPPLIHGAPTWIPWVAALVFVLLLIVLSVVAWALSGIVDDHHYQVDEWDTMGAETDSFTDPDWRRGS